MGYNMMLFASDVQRAAIFAMRRLLDTLKTERTTEFFDDMVNFQDREAIEHSSLPAAARRYANAGVVMVPSVSRK